MSLTINGVNPLHRPIDTQFAWFGCSPIKFLFPFLIFDVKIVSPDKEKYTICGGYLFTDGPTEI